jgi:hypothetical protein
MNLTNLRSLFSIPKRPFSLFDGIFAQSSVVVAEFPTYEPLYFLKNTTLLPQLDMRVASGWMVDMLNITFSQQEAGPSHFESMDATRTRIRMGF